MVEYGTVAPTKYEYWYDSVQYHTGEERMSRPTCAAIVHGRCLVGNKRGEVSTHALATTISSPVCSRGEIIAWTRRASAVRCILETDLINANGSNGMVLGSADGSVTYLHKGATVCEHSLLASISTLSRLNSDGVPAVAAADIAGTMLVFGVLGPLWRLRLQDLAALNGCIYKPSAYALLPVQRAPMVSDVAVDVPADVAIDATDDKMPETATEHLLAAVGERTLLELDSSSGRVLHLIESPSAMTALARDQGFSSVGGTDMVGMKRGRAHLDDGSSQLEAGSAHEHVLGNVIVATTDYTVLFWPGWRAVATVGVRVTCMDASSWSSHGLLACSGHFSGALIVRATGEYAIDRTIMLLQRLCLAPALCWSSPSSVSG